MAVLIEHTDRLRVADLVPIGAFATLYRTSARSETHRDPPFTIARCPGDDWIIGCSMDWLIQYGPGDFGIVQNEKFRQVFRKSMAQVARPWPKPA
jgi:hypothetical protein